MRVLFVGDYDLAGSYIASRLYREGDQVCWLTQEEELQLWDRKVKGKVYRKPVTYSVCRKILAAESIDCLFFLAGGHREDFFSQKEKTSLLSQLEPVLRAANGHKLRRVCLLSSVDLEEEGLLSPALEELRAGERVLLSHCRERRLPVLLLRTGCVFGEAPPDQGGFLGQVLTQLQGSGKVLCPFREEASFDFVCGSDLADAVCRLFHLEAGGVYRVVTGAPVTAGELYAMAAQALGKEPQVEFGEEDHSAPGPALGKELREACGWMPFYLFKETGPVYVKSSLSRERERQKGEEKRRLSLRKRQPLLFETLQNLGLFLIMLLLTGWTADWNDLRYVDVRLLYVVIVAISFGMRQGLLATVLAIASYVAALLRAQIDISCVFYSVESWIPFILYGVAGAFGGYWSDKKYDDYDSLADQYREQGERYDFLKELYREVVDVKNQLQRQIVVSRDSLGRLYSITEELQSPSPRTVCVKTIGVMEDIMECESAALYIHQDGGNFGRLMACSQGLSSTLAPSVDLEKRPKLQEAMERRELYVNTELDPDYPAMAMPICDGETSIGMAVLYHLDPQQYTVYYKNLFQTLTRMIQDNLIRAVRYQQQNWEKLTLPGTLVLTKEAFAQELSALRLSKEELHCPVSVARVGLPPRTPEGTRGSLQGWGMLGRESQGGGDQSPAALYNRAASLLRGTDLLGIGENGDLEAAFLYVGPSRRPVLEERFSRSGFTLTWLD